MAEYRELSYEEASAELEAQLEPETDWPDRDDLGAQAAEDAAISELERLEREDRRDATRF
jgi:hypothetical protein